MYRREKHRIPCFSFGYFRDLGNYILNEYLDKINWIIYSYIYLYIYIYINTGVQYLYSHTNSVELSPGVLALLS